MCIRDSVKGEAHVNGKLVCSGELMFSLVDWKMVIKNTQIESNFKGARVHPNAFVDATAELHDGVSIACGAIVGPNVIIGSGTKIGPNSVIEGKTKIGKYN